MQLDKFFGTFYRMRPGEPRATRIRFIVRGEAASRKWAPDRLLNIVSMDFDIAANEWTIIFVKGLAVEQGEKESPDADKPKTD